MEINYFHNSTTKLKFRHFLNANFTIFLLYYRECLGTKLGRFRFNLYFISGIIFNILAAWITYLITGYSMQPSLISYTAPCFAFAAMYPDMQFLMYF